MNEHNRVALGRTPDIEDSWKFIGIERTTKLVLAYHVSVRVNSSVQQFLQKLNNATTSHVQISTHGLGVYTHNVPFTFWSGCDFGQLIKNFQGGQSSVRYSQPTYFFCREEC
ncbi:hypothetical protein Pla144_04840 [Bythopirellula polymerisocia]|uniref:Uncharacterized protein n=1 Tax=Bythopirellula polymerisocia TaxID=2528003 RepID=A0A5C6D0L5_9BACT|nr:hypothetical protein Pla144_04840 [Bythopirellula polymerisocia]